MRKERRTSQVFIRLTPTERAEIDRLSEERGVTMTDLVIGAIFGNEPTTLVARLVKLESRLRDVEARLDDHDRAHVKAMEE